VEVHLAKVRLDLVLSLKKRRIVYLAHVPVAFEPRSSWEIELWLRPVMPVSPSLFSSFWMKRRTTLKALACA